MANVIWNEKEQKWVCRVTVDRITKKFVSRVKGPAGKRRVLQSVQAFESGLHSDSRTIEDEWQRYIQDVEYRSSLCNVQNLAQIKRLYFPSTILRRKFKDVHLTDFQRVINEARKQDGTPLSRKSLSNIRTTIVSFLNYARIDGATDMLPNGLYIPKIALEKKEKQILQPHQIRAIFSKYDDEFYINLWRLMLLTGLRPGEALGLQWSDIKNNRIVISRSINRNREITPGKNVNARRMIPISDILIKILEDQRQRTLYMKSEWIFPSHSGTIPSQSSIKNSLYRISKDLGTSVSPYCLRHTFISMVKNELPEQMIRQIVGHSASMDTFGTYGHMVDGEIERASAQISTIYKNVL